MRSEKEIKKELTRLNRKRTELEDKYRKIGKIGVLLGRAAKLRSKIDFITGLTLAFAWVLEEDEKQKP